MKSPNTLEVLSAPQTVGDLWDELQKDINPIKKFLTFEENREYVIRLLGPFMQASRLYNPQYRIVTKNQIDVKRIASRDEKYFNEAINKIEELTKEASDIGKKKYHELERFLTNLYINFGFEKCVVTNVYIKSGDRRGEPKVKLVALTNSICKEIVQKVPELSTKISGLNAKDIIITRRGSGLITRYSADIIEQNMLEAPMVKKVFSHGLIDIPSLLNAINSRNGEFYYQFQSDKYIMPDKLTNCLLNDIKVIDENQQLHRANDKIHTLPRNAFEKISKPSSLICGLDIEEDDV